MIKEDTFKDLLNYMLIIILFILTFFIIKPLFFSIVYGLLAAYILYPLHKFTLRKVKNNSLSALIICLLLLILLLVFFSVILGTIFSQLINFYHVSQKIDIVSLAKSLFPLSEEISKNVADSIKSSLSSLLSKYVGYIGDFILNIPDLIIQLFVVFLILFYALKDGEQAFKYFKSLSPLKKETQEKFFKHFKDITNSVLIGHVIVGVIQGIVSGIGYFIFGIPNALLLTALTIILSILPFIGPWLVWVPVDIYLFAIGRTNAGLGLLIYGLLVVGWIDAIIRPLIVSRRTQINPAIVLVGMLGGIYVFGILGFIIGPLTLAYVILVLEVYRKHSLGESIIFKNPSDFNPFENK